MRATTGTSPRRYTALAKCRSKRAPSAPKPAWALAVVRTRSRSGTDRTVGFVSGCALMR